MGRAYSPAAGRWWSDPNSGLSADPISVSAMPAVDVSSAIDQLRSSLDAGDTVRAGGVLDGLRRAWRRGPGRFTTAELAALRDLAVAVGAARIGAVDDVLRDVFGYPSFRPGPANRSRTN